LRSTLCAGLVRRAPSQRRNCPFQVEVEAGGFIGKKCAPSFKSLFLSTHDRQSCCPIEGLQKFVSCALKGASNTFGPGSNIPYVSLVLNAVELWPDVCSVQASCGGDAIDIVSARGLSWTLLSAASPRRLPRVFNQGLALKVLRLIHRARQCCIFYSTPRIFFRSLHPLPTHIRCAAGEDCASALGVPLTNLPQSVAQPPWSFCRWKPGTRLRLWSF
jgi:hypothetical protein